MARIECPHDGCTYVVPEGHGDATTAALITAHSKTHDSKKANGEKAEKVRRPAISSEGTTEAWTYFLSRWGHYVKATKITAEEQVLQLLECCDDRLRHDLTRNARKDLSEETVEVVLAAIRKLAVRSENLKVARVTLHSMCQGQEESVRAFGARLRGQASICKYEVSQACECGRNVTIDYSEENVSDLLCIGLADPDIKKALLSDENQERDVEQTLKFVEAREEGRRSAPKLSTPQAVEAVSSSYRKLKRPAQRGHINRDEPARKDNTHEDGKCSYCGGTGHGRNAPTRVRRTRCPAFGRKCKHCGKENHLAKVCRSEPMQDDSQHENALFDETCTLTTLDAQDTSTLSHHVYDQSTKSWIRRQSKPQPFIQLQVEINQADYAPLGYQLDGGNRRSSTEALADTGCQSCLTGTATLAELRLSTTDLIPVNLKMRVANEGQINIQGAIIMRLTNPRTDKTTRQMVYVTPDVTKLYISREACADLGIIEPSFPNTAAAAIRDTGGTPRITPTQGIAHTERCSCPRREKPPLRPTPPPFPITEENRGKLEEHLLHVYSSSTFNTCEHQPLPLMSGPPLRLAIDPLATPTAHHTPIPVPLHWQEEVKAGLDRDVRLGVLEQVPIGTLVTWCHRMVVCPKKNGSLRRTIDFQALNRHATRETHHTQSPFHQARSVPLRTKKTIFDAWNGYHSVALHEADRHFTTFITPWGRYRYCTAPQGYIASGDGYTSRYDGIVAHIQNKTKCIDDTLLWSQTVEEAYRQATEWLDTCGNNGVTLNPTKFRFARDEVEFAGFDITPTTVKPCQKYVKAISDFPTPKNLTDVRSWFGLVNQVSYAFSMTAAMAPFRELLKPTQKFEWTASHDAAFRESKRVIAQEIQHGVEIFDKNKPTCLATDWSKDGVGYWLFQKHCSCPSEDIFCCKTGWRITLVGSRFTHSAESRYAPIEGEALAVADALDKARHFVLGCKNLTIAVDHKPLLKVFGDRSIDQIGNTRLRNLKEKTLRYRFRMIHIPGVRNKTPDALSRYPTGTTTPDRMILPDDAHTITSHQPQLRPSIPSILMSGISSDDCDADADADWMEHIIQDSLAQALSSTQPLTWEQVQTATAADTAMQDLMEAIEDGFPDRRSSLPQCLKAYHAHRRHLTTSDGVAVYKDRIIVPQALRKTCLSSLHAAHQGTSQMIAKAEASIFWPGITTDIHATRAACDHCNKMAPSQAAMPPVPPTMADYPFQCLCADYFHHLGKNYLVLIDRYSNWPIVKHADDGARGVVKALRRIFSTFGIPDELATDGGPEFTSTTTTQFLQDWGIHHRLSSVAFPHSNCRAEVGVKTMKRLLTGNVTANGNLDSDAFQRAILQYRNTPDPATRMSPAMCVFGRPVKDLIPILPGKFDLHTMWKQNLDIRERALSHKHALADRRWTEHTKSLPPMAVRGHSCTHPEPNRTPS